MRSARSSPPDLGFASGSLSRPRHCSSTRSPRSSIRSSIRSGSTPRPETLTTTTSSRWRERTTSSSSCPGTRTSSSSRSAAAVALRSRWPRRSRPNRRSGRPVYTLTAVPEQPRAPRQTVRAFAGPTEVDDQRPPADLLRRDPAAHEPVTVDLVGTRHNREWYGAWYGDSQGDRHAR